MFTRTTLPANCASVFDTRRPFRSGTLKRNGSEASAIVVWRDGSVGDPIAPGPRVAFADGGELGLPVLSQEKAAVWLWDDFKQERPCTGEMTQDVAAVAIRAGQRAGIAIDAENARRNNAVLLTRDESPRRLTFRALRRNNPGALERWRATVDATWSRRPGACGFERICHAGAASILAHQLAVVDRGLELGGVLIERKAQPLAFDATGRRSDPPVAIEERAGENASGSGNLKAERNLDAVDDDRRLPSAGHRRRLGTCPSRAKQECGDDGEGCDGSNSNARSSSVTPVGTAASSSPAAPHVAYASRHGAKRQRARRGAAATIDPSSRDMGKSAERRGARAASGVRNSARVLSSASYNKPNAGVWCSERGRWSGSFRRVLTQEQRQLNCAEFFKRF